MVGRVAYESDFCDESASRKNVLPVNPNANTASDMIEKFGKIFEK